MTTFLDKSKMLFSFTKEAYFPCFCINCQEEILTNKYHLCEICALQIERIKSQVCPKCGRLSKKGKYCPNCRQKSALNGLLISAKFEGPVRELVHYLKYDKYLSITELLSTFVSETVEIFRGDKNVVIVPVPLHPLKKLERGFNQSELLAKKISKRLNIPTKLYLKRVKHTDSQMKLKRKERLKNLDGAFKARYLDQIPGKVVLLLDDVTTTGTTLEECARVLRAAGAKQIWGVVVAKG